MISAEGETVQLIKPVQIVPKVEIWLEALSEEMRHTLQRLVREINFFIITFTYSPVKKVKKIQRIFLKK